MYTVQTTHYSVLGHGGRRNALIPSHLAAHDTRGRANNLLQQSLISPCYEPSDGMANDHHGRSRSRRIPTAVKVQDGSYGMVEELSLNKEQGGAAH